MRISDLVSGFDTELIGSSYINLMSQIYILDQIL